MVSRDYWRFTVDNTGDYRTLLKRILEITGDYCRDYWRLQEITVEITGGYW